MSLNRLDHIPQRNYAIFLAPEQEPVAKIKVVGVGGGGCNSINSMITRGLTGVEFIAINTDVQSLNACIASNKIQIGATITRGLGTGGNVELGKRSAEEDREKILKALDGAEMVFITTGEGGGTGTGASPVIGSIARSTGALVVAVVTKPSIFEGNQRVKIAEKGINELREYCDSIIVIPNDNIQLAIHDNASAFEGYDKPNEVLYNAVRGISDLILKNGNINVDFADVKTVLRDSGDALMGIGRASGQNKVIEAFNKAISSPLLEEIDLRNVHSILINFTGSSKMTYTELNEAKKRLNEMINPNSFIKFGIVKDEDLSDEVMVTIIATGYSKIPRLISTDMSDTKMKLVTEEKVATNHTIIESNEIDLIIGNKTYNPDEDTEFIRPAFDRLKVKPSNINKENDENRAQEKSEKTSLLDELKRKNQEDEDISSALLRKLMD